MRSDHSSRVFWEEGLSPSQDTDCFLLACFMSPLLTPFQTSFRGISVPWSPDQRGVLPEAQRWYQDESPRVRHSRNVSQTPHGSQRRAGQASLWDAEIFQPGFEPFSLGFECGTELSRNTTPLAYPHWDGSVSGQCALSGWYLRCNQAGSELTVIFNTK